nr:MAG TPA: hypothetical protein [Caudoviricetes sp.]
MSIDTAKPCFVGFIKIIVLMNIYELLLKRN